MKPILRLILLITLTIYSLQASESNPTQEEIAKLYVATFNRAPDAAGLAYWTSSGDKLTEIAASFFVQTETKALYPSGTSNASFITAVYQNLFNRKPDTAGLNYWEDELNRGVHTRDTFIQVVINGALDNEVSNDATALANKALVGLYFANAGLDDLDKAKSIMSNITDDVSTVNEAISIITQWVQDNISEPEESDGYKEWIQKGKPEREVIPIQYLPPRNESYNRNFKKRVVFPSKFDLRDPNGDGNTVNGTISPIKDQGACGSCWVFATLGAIESSYNKTTFFDFSEDNLRHRHGFNNGGPCKGGHLLMSAPYLVRYDGAVSEAEDPYQLGSYEYCTDCKSKKYIDDITFYFGRDSLGILNIDLIKDILVNQKKAPYAHVEVSSGTAGESGSSIYDSSTKSFYQSRKFSSPNHAIVIVGYDDNMKLQGQTGGFIVKNSWGNAASTDNGYNYIPYTDTTIASWLIGVYNDVDESEFKFDNIYLHDEHGIDGVGMLINDVLYGMNIFQANANEAIVGLNVGIYSQGRELDLEIHKLDGDTLPIWGDASTRLGSRIENKEAFEMGYHTLQLDENLSVKSGDKFAVIGKYTKVSGITDDRLPVENKNNGSDGESYLAGDGAHWYDISSNLGANLSIKVFTINYTGDGNIAPVADAGKDQTVVTSSLVALDGSDSFDVDGSIFSYTWSFTDKPDSSLATFTAINSATATPTFTADVDGTYIAQLIVNDGTTNSAADTVQIIASTEKDDNGNWKYGTIISSITQRIWLDRNLGASQVCTQRQDSKCYGDHYQWGRDADGHEKTDYSDPSSTTQASTINPGHEKFIKDSADWTTADISGSIRSANWNPCPSGFRIPTADELRAENILNYDDAYSILKLPSDGFRRSVPETNPIYYPAGSGGIWSSSSFDNFQAQHLFFFGAGGYIANNNRANGYSVRCIKDDVAIVEAPKTKTYTIVSIPDTKYSSDDCKNAQGTLIINDTVVSGSILSEWGLTYDIGGTYNDQTNVIDGGFADAGAGDVATYEGTINNEIGNGTWSDPYCNGTWTATNVDTVKNNTLMYWDDANNYCVSLGKTMATFEQYKEAYTSGIEFTQEEYWTLESWYSDSPYVGNKSWAYIPGDTTQHMTHYHDRHQLGVYCVE